MEVHPKIQPPVYFVIYFILAVILNRFFPIIRLAPLPILGFFIGLVGFLTGFWAMSIFRRKKTTYIPGNRSRVLVMEGPYLITRNPMYVAFTLMLLGEAIYLGSLSAFLAPVLMYITLDTQIIPLEEKILEETFQEKYRQYKKQVRRWL